MSADQTQANEQVSLSSLSVLVTRPAQQQQSLLSAIETRSGRALGLPMLAIEPLQDAAAKQKARAVVQDLDQFQWLIFVSNNAARLGCELINDFWPQFPVGVALAAIGRSTAETLSSLLDQAVVRPPQGSDSEALLALPEFKDVADKKIAIFRGVGGRALLANTLEQRGAHVQYVELYTREPVAYESAVVVSQLRENSINTLTVHSGESLQQLVEVLGDQLPSVLQLPLVVPSTRVERQGRELGFVNIVCALGADDASMLSALQGIVETP